MELSEAFAHALDGQAIMFAGAGFSVDAKAYDNNRIPTAQGLAKILADEIQLKETPNLQLASEMYVSHRGEPSLIRLLQSRFRAHSITQYQESIAALPWRRIYTTNYDDVIELACVS